MPNVAKYCFTINGYTQEEYDYWCNHVPSTCEYLVMGKEIAPTTGMRHIQGFIKFHRTAKKSVKAVKEIFRRNDIHLEATRGTDQQADEYCKKEGDFDTFGDLGASKDNQGRRSDLDAFKEDVKNGMVSLKTIQENHSTVYARHKNFVLEYLAFNKPVSAPKVIHPLKEWQQELNLILNRPADDRTIHFMVDLRGNSGKSWFAQYYLYNHPETTQIIRPGKKLDMAYEVSTDTKVFFFDAPRSKQNEYLQYDLLEELKDGLVFSGKYFPMTKRWEHNVHVVVMMNEHPDDKKLSADRYNVVNI